MDRTTPPRRRPRIRAVVRRGVFLVGVLVVAGGAGVVTAPIAAADEPPVVINAGGGTAPGDGLQVHYGSGELQIIRAGSGQLYGPGALPSETLLDLYNTIGLHAEGTSVGTGLAQPWDDVTASGGSANGDGTITSALTVTLNGRLYRVDAVIDYVYPRERFAVTLTLTIPDGAPSDVRLYHMLDTYLSGDDAGPGFHTTVAGAETVGVSDPESSVVEALRYRSGPAWTGHFSGYYDCPWDPAAAAQCGGSAGWAFNGEDFPNLVDGDPSTDNAIGIMWNLGTTPGAATMSNDLVFTNGDVARLSKELADDSITAGQTTDLVYTFTNDPTLSTKLDLGFADSLPPGLVVAGPPVTTCGGSVDAVEGQESISFTGGGLADGAATCTITVPVMATGSGTFVIDGGVDSSTSTVRSVASDQTLTVTGAQPTASFAQETITVAETDGTVGLPIVLDQPAAEGDTIDYVIELVNADGSDATVGGTPIANGLGGTLTLAAGAMEAAIDLSVLNDSNVDGTRMFRVRLISTGTVLADDELEVSITDNDLPADIDVVSSPGQATIAGEGYAPGAVVTLTVDGSGTTLTTVADGSGNVVFRLPLGTGSTSVSMSGADPDGGILTQGSTITASSAPTLAATGPRPLGLMASLAVTLLGTGALLRAAALHLRPARGRSA
ncbi:MAG: hypothetical protein S0880_18060 [Actinomycetota bacterium]|nr:hypothetical protein [Actinomycetota bacterium]